MLNRLLIVSFNLKERATGKSFDEAASDAEIKESIFYDSAPTTDEDSILFWGLCSALYNTFSPGDGSTVIQLERETLIVFPLEDDAVVAIARLSKNVPETRSPSLNVVRNVKRSHELFCLLREGGILPRVDDNESLQKLFDLHKLVRTSPDAQTELDSFRSQLTLARLREELSIHYDTFMTEPMSNLDCPFGLLPPIQYLPPRSKHGGSTPGVGKEEYNLLAQTLQQARDSDDCIIDILAVKNDGTVFPTKKEPNLAAQKAPILQGYLLQIRESFSILPSLASNYFVVPAASPVTNMTPGFLPPPPLANLSSLDTIVEEVRFIPSENSDEMSTAWAPRVYLGPDEQYRVLLFDANILVFIREDCETFQGSSAVVSYLKKASDLLGGICSENCDVVPCTTNNERVECTLLPNDDVWIYRSSTRNIVVDAAKCKNLADVQQVISM